MPPFPPSVWRLPLLSLLACAALALLELNQPAFLWLNALSAITGELMWAAITIHGDGLTALALLLLFWHRQPRLVWAGVLAGMLGALAIHTLKPAFNTLRPPGELPLECFTVIGPAHAHFSFPSGHTATVFALAGVILLNEPRLRPPWPHLILLAAILVGWSRIVVGVHWPVDVLAGAALGWICALGGSVWARHWTWGESTTGQTVLGIMLGLCAVWLLTGHDTGYPQAVGWQRAVALLSLLAGVLTLAETPTAQRILRATLRPFALTVFPPLVLWWPPRG